MYELGMCYKCKYRGDVPGVAHSCCHYPGNDTNLFSMFESANFLQAAKLDIRAEKHGVMSGWFMWPVNFDPIWLRSCNGFTPKDSGETNG